MPYELITANKQSPEELRLVFATMNLEGILRALLTKISLVKEDENGNLTVKFEADKIKETYRRFDQLTARGRPRETQ